jgi:hypothetical protein
MTQNKLQTGCLETVYGFSKMKKEVASNAEAASSLFITGSGFKVSKVAMREYRES